VVVYDVFTVADMVSATSGGTFSGATTHNAGITSTSITATGDVSLDGGSFVFNESSADKDFRVESNGNTHMLFVDGGNDAVGIGISNPASYNTYADELVVGGTDGNRGITIVGGDDDYSIINLNRYSNTSDTPNGAIEYNHNSNEMYIKANALSALQLNSDGSVNKPLQPCFQARPSGVISNITTASSQTLSFATEVFDLNADYNTSNYNFVAPVTGKYLLTLNLRVQALDISGSYFQALILTSNKEYQSIISTNRFSADPAYWYIGVTVVADMDASDTAIPRVYISSDSAAQVDIDDESYFSGCLLA